MNSDPRRHEANHPVEVPQRAFEAALALRAEALDIGAAPVDAVLTGARRRAARRRTALAMTAVAVLAGTASGLGVLLTGSGSGKVGPGRQSGIPETSSPASAAAAIRHVPATVSQYDGLAPGQQAQSSDPVTASGVEDGLPWEISVHFAPDQKTLEAKFWKAGVLVKSETIGPPTPDTPLTAPMTFPGSGLSSLFFLVPKDTAYVVWTGQDGFRKVVQTLPAHRYGSAGELRLAVFPGGLMTPQVGDEFTGYDASRGKQMVYLRVTPMLLGHG